MGLDAALLTASSGLNSINSAIAVLSQNVANVSTPNYSREISVQVSAAAGGVGMGVVTRPTIRDVNTQMQAQSLQQNATVSGLQTRQQALQQIDAVQGTPGGGTDLASLVGALGDAFSTLQNDPSNQTQQNAVVSAAQSLALQINALSAAYQTGRQTAQDGLLSGVATLNDTLSSIGSLSDEIVQDQANGVSTADLENQRDAAENTLSQLVSVNFVNQPDGDVQAFTSGGLNLPTHFTTPPFAVASATIGAGASYPGNGVPAVTLGGADVTGQLTGGQLGAQITLRDTTLPTDQAELDEFSQTLSSRFAAQGLTLFTQPDGTLPTGGGSPAQSGYIGYAATITVNPAVVRTPSLVRDGTQDVTGGTTAASAFTVNPSGGPVGFTDLITRVLSYALGSEAQAGVAQPAPAVSGLGADGTLSAPFAAPDDLADFATDLVSAQAQDSSTTTTDLTNAQALQSNLQSNLSSATGVNIDTEMSNMVALQNAYGANAKIIATLQAMFTDVLDMLGT
jgi:flagellar hook-associated protein 1 FlgK